MYASFNHRILQHFDLKPFNLTVSLVSATGEFLCITVVADGGSQPVDNVLRAASRHIDHYRCDCQPWRRLQLHCLHRHQASASAAERGVRLAGDTEKRQQQTGSGCRFHTWQSDVFAVSCVKWSPIAGLDSGVMRTRNCQTCCETVAAAYSRA